MSVLRAFIALDLSLEIYQRLEQVLVDLRARPMADAVRWVPARNIHLTIKFLGDVSLSSLDLLKRMLQTEAARHPAFEISVGELGAFPSLRRPRVVWVGVEAPPELAALQHGVEVEMARLGYPPEERPFSPHLTLGRVARNAGPDEQQRLSSMLAACKVGFLGAARLQAVHLYRSDLQPGGSVYTKLFSAPLAAPTAA
ncbi:MAG: RNA 2',3'-cyclic phosphodiesterase [Chloroflexota bacterium]